MIAALCAQTVDASGCVELEINFAGSDLDSLTRRISRTATLDGGVVVEDQGYADGDRTVLLAAEPTAAALSGLQYLIRNYGLVVASLPDGCYLAGISDLRANGETMSVSLLIKERLSE